MKVKYQFEMIKNGSISEGYVSIPIKDGIAKIDPDNSDEVKLAKDLGGQPVVEKKSNKKQVTK